MKQLSSLMAFVAIVSLVGVAAPAAEDAKKPTLRRPGFMFTELGTPRVDEYIDYFQAVAGYKVKHREAGYASLETEVAQLLLIDPKMLPKGHPFYEPPPGDKRGYSVEIGLVVADLDATFAAATKFKDWKISAGIAKRPWGVRDFRVLTPDGYYLRFTE